MLVSTPMVKGTKIISWEKYAEGPLLITVSYQSVNVSDA